MRASEREARCRRAPKDGNLGKAIPYPCRSYKKSESPRKSQIALFLWTVLSNIIDTSISGFIPRRAATASRAAWIVATPAVCMAGSRSMATVWRFSCPAPADPCRILIPQGEGVEIDPGKVATGVHRG